jgi:hypothetical protein
MEHGKAVPVGADGIQFLGKIAGERQDSGAILAYQRAHADHDPADVSRPSASPRSRACVDQVALVSRPRP